MNSSADRRIYAISALEAIGPAAADEPQAVPALVKVLEGDDEIARYAALGALNKLGPRAEDAVPVLVATLDTSSRHRDEREWAAGVLVSIGPKGERALLDVLARNPTASKTLVVLRVLGREAPDTREQWLCKPEVVAAVIELTTSVSDFDRGDVVLVLSKFGRAALPVLQTALTHSEAIVRQMATYTLGEIGPEATPTEPALARLVEQDQSQEVRNAAATALGKIRRGGNVETDPALPGRAANEARPDKEQLNAVAEFQQRTPRALGVAVVLLFSVGLVYGLVWLTSRSSCRRSAG